MMTRRPPSLVDLCVQLAIDNIRFIGNVGDIDYHLLDRILSHCSLDQLKKIEEETDDRDLTPVTDKLWKKFYKDQFGVDSMNTVVERMRKRKMTVEWKRLFELKLEEREEATKKCVDRMRQRYKEEEARKQSRQVQVCSKVPPSSKKRSYDGGAIAYNINNTKSNVMKKAKQDYRNSLEVKNITAMRKTVVHRTPITSHSREVKNIDAMRKTLVPRTPIRGGKNIAAMGKPVLQRTPIVSSSRKPAGTSGLGSSSSKLMKPVQRRFGTC